MSAIKCFKCRAVLLKDTEIEQLSPHGDTNQTSAGVSIIRCESMLDDKLIYLKDDLLPQWIIDKVQESNWTKGRLHCEQCKTKIGHFDFVTGRKCHCEETVLPPVYFIKSQVDRPLNVKL